MHIVSKKLFRFLFLFVLGCSILPAARSQAVSPGMEVLQMIKVANTYRYAPNLSFDVQVTYADSVAVDSVVEQITANYKLHSGLFYTYIDSTEIVQGNLYNVRVSHTDSVITIRNRDVYPDVLNMPVTDTLYWRTFAQGLTATDINDSTRALKIIFKPGAVFSSYEIKYSTRSFLLQEVKCYMPADTTGADPGLYASGKALIKFVFSGYSTSAVGNEWFSEDKFVSLINGRFQPKPDYNGYFIETTIAQ